MKKRNRVLEAILCAALAVVVFWGYMFAAKDNGVFALEAVSYTHLDVYKRQTQPRTFFARGIL